MIKVLKSDLTHSLGFGFLAGALALLFFMQPVEQRADMQQNLSATVSSATQLFG